MKTNTHTFQTEKNPAAQAPHKSIWLAVLLSLLFGPPGMLYVTDRGALIMWVIHPVLAFYGQGKYFFISLAICVGWSLLACWKYNRSLQADRQAARSIKSGTFSSMIPVPAIHLPKKFSRLNPIYV